MKRVQLEVSNDGFCTELSVRYLFIDIHFIFTHYHIRVSTDRRECGDYVTSQWPVLVVTGMVTGTLRYAPDTLSYGYLCCTFTDVFLTYQIIMVVANVYNDNQTLRVPEPPVQSTMTGLIKYSQQTFLATLNTCQNGDPHIQQ